MFDTVEIIQTERRYDEGYERVSPVTGLRQSYSGGYWYPVVDFEPSAPMCAEQVNGLTRKIEFADDGPKMTVDAPLYVSALTMTIVRCLFDDSLMVEVDPAGGLPEALAVQRAEVLAKELVQRGVPSNRISVGTVSAPIEYRTTLRWANAADGG